MGVRLRAAGERVTGTVTLDRRHEGAPGFAHGGAVATVLDDALGSLLTLLRKPAVTARLEVNYRRPAYVGRPFQVEAWVERIEGRKLHLAGALSDAVDRIADASGLFLRVDAEHFLRGAREAPELWRRIQRGEGPELPW
jgi:acyl-coenzyme A thioesterase PaaI-like protein